MNKATSSSPPHTEYFINNAGMLRFNDSTDFANTMTLLVNQTPAYLDNWENTHNFYSMRRYYRDLDSSLYDSITVTNPRQLDTIPVEDEYFATVLNSDGRVQIGSNIYRVTYSTVYHYDTLGNLIDTFQVQRGSSGGGTPPPTSCVTGWKSVVPHYHVTGSSSYRMEGCSWVINWGVHNSTGSWTSYDILSHYRFFGWHTRWKGFKAWNLAVNPGATDYDLSGFTFGCARHDPGTHKTYVFSDYVEYVAYWQPGAPVVTNPICVCNAYAWHCINDAGYSYCTYTYIP